LTQAAQRRGGVTIPGGVKEKSECGTEGHVCSIHSHASVVGLEDLSGLSNLNDSMIARFKIVVLRHVWGINCYKYSAVFRRSILC